MEPNSTKSIFEFISILYLVLITFISITILSIDYFSLPNLLAGSKLSPELLQSDVSLDNIVGAIDEISLKGLEHYHKNFHLIHENLKAGSSETAAKEIFNLVN